MKLSEAIDLCRLHVRRNTFIEEVEWRALLNQSCMELAKQTHILHDDFRITLQENVIEYDLSAARIYRVLGNARHAGDEVERIALFQVLELDEDETGTPRYIYELGSFTLGVWPKPTQVATDDALVIHANYFPATIDSTTPGSDELPFEVADHGTVVYGAVLLAERIDTDFTASELLRKDYEQGIMSMRARAQNRMPGLKTARRYFDGR